MCISILKRVSIAKNIFSFQMHLWRLALKYWKRRRIVVSFWDILKMVNRDCPWSGGKLNCQQETTVFCWAIDKPFVTLIHLYLIKTMDAFHLQTITSPLPFSEPEKHKQRPVRGQEKYVPPKKLLWLHITTLPQNNLLMLVYFSTVQKNQQQSLLGTWKMLSILMQTAHVSCPHCCGFTDAPAFVLLKSWDFHPIFHETPSVYKQQI